MKIKAWTSAFLLAVSLTGFAADKQGGRSAPGDFKVPDDISYQVRSYRTGEYPRANQIGIAVAKEHLGKTIKLPVVVFIHGGGWRNGDKDQAAWQCMRYAKAGYVAITVSYRLTGEAPFPACILDVMEAVRYIKSICPEISGDPEHIGVQGYSAGAHLALMIALANDDEALNSGTYPEYDSKVKCVLAISAPTDFVERRKRTGPIKMFSDEQNENQSFMERISPLYSITSEQIPIMMLHGTADPLVPAYHYESFQEKCETTGVDNFKLMTHPDGGHMFFFKENETYFPIIEAYFGEQLKSGNQ